MTAASWRQKTVPAGRAAHDRAHGGDTPLPRSRPLPSATVNLQEKRCGERLIVTRMKRRRRRDENPDRARRGRQAGRPRPKDRRRDQTRSRDRQRQALRPRSIARATPARGCDDGSYQMAKGDDRRPRWPGNQADLHRGFQMEEHGERRIEDGTSKCTERSVPTKIEQRLAALGMHRNGRKLAHDQGERWATPRR